MRKINKATKKVAMNLEPEAEATVCERKENKKMKRNYYSSLLPLKK